jgi:hypothetical protein
MKRILVPALLAGTLGLWSCTDETSDGSEASDNKEAVETKPASFKIDGMT